MRNCLHSGKRNTPRELLANTDYLLPSIEEAHVYRDAVGKSSFEALRPLLKCRPRAAAVKMGSRLRYRGHRPYRCRDAFCAGFLVGIVRTSDPVTAALYGAVSASFIIEGFGPLHALGTPLHEVEQRL